MPPMPQDQEISQKIPVKSAFQSLHSYSVFAYELLFLAIPAIQQFCAKE